ncbi:unnamed protein product [Spodoptera exigua]|nr:unnamed protein product [Spodoptera exigua]
MWVRGGTPGSVVPTSSGNSPPRKFIYQVSVGTSAPKDKRLEIAGGRGAPDALVDTGHWLLPNINSVHGNRILLFNRTIEVRAGAISHGDASAGGCRERWRTTAMPSRLQAPLGARRYVLTTAALLRRPHPRCTCCRTRFRYAYLCHCGD